MMEAVDPDRLVGEQLSHYRAIAAEYDEAVKRDRGEPERPELEAAVARFEPTGAVLDLAAGTGQWTAVFARYATRLTVRVFDSEEIPPGHLVASGVFARADAQLSGPTGHPPHSIGNLPDP